ncbi:MULTISPECIES: hypothetical protein [unclassified Mesorhizobium]|uniref:hypothetical protein n=1 Tax=unclassified Mesorhizobium TaxID=325217 RepID=UPI000BAFCEBA|nr:MULTISPECIES: hypothetical protein [unclassified Mesorhizobium]TGT61009.1 hypothetical protein EN813_018770 [Mesorhizobium sp. M00.F.Ca.ET.170.01.1.1]AZO08779.1 hypothetical protein EJ074_06395 [Mesorhizobium sp. M3A.F.Ca.ET.080.04.2.1]PBB84074.1 hypothetical protein CK216_25160 [Mesorhizobium sp. WSM3876]RWB72096.1 MAG: hypothetical protein EOQ49_12660 [Mesorhizobium sp.]RWB83698.1 MAG: hypothetical protein EOQ52_26220 [Mesorhizobium sp.]
MLYTSVLDIHAFAMMAAVVLFLAAELLLFAGTGGDAKMARFALGTSRSANVVAMIGMLAGIALLYLGGWSLLTPWLLLSFALIAAMMVVNRRFVRPWQKKVQAAIADASRSDLGALAGDRRALVGRVAVIALFALVGALMMLKPELALLA